MSIEMSIPEVTIHLAGFKMGLHRERLTNLDYTIVSSKRQSFSRMNLQNVSLSQWFATSFVALGFITIIVILWIFYC